MIERMAVLLLVAEEVFPMPQKHPLQQMLVYVGPGPLLQADLKG